MSDTDESNIEGVRVGEVLAGKYRIERVLGTGGMGVVVAARHLQLDEMVAIKYLLPGALEHPTAASRFLREAKAAVRIKSEHVARVSDVGTLSSGAPYLVMEYLEGGDLAQWLRKNGKMPVEQAVEFVLQALEAIADAHGLGIIHRDLKPANLFCVRRNDGLLSIKLLDFGISKLHDSQSVEHGDITAPAVVMGSPLYMSPEQMRSARDVDARTDIWSIGIILYELLTGVAPFGGTSVSEICVRAASEPPAPMRSFRPDLPSELECVILKCLEKDRNNRYGNVAELAAKLVPFAPRRARPSVERIARIIAAAGITEMPELPPASVAAPLSVRTDGNWGHTKTRVQFARRGVVGVVVASLATLVAIGLFLTLRPGPSHSVAGATTDSMRDAAAWSATTAEPAVMVIPVQGDAGLHSSGAPPLEVTRALERSDAAPRRTESHAPSRKPSSERRDLFDTPH